MLTPRKDVLENSSQLLHSPSDDVGTDGILLADERERAAGEVLFLPLSFVLCNLHRLCNLNRKKAGKIQSKIYPLKKTLFSRFKSTQAL